MNDFLESLDRLLGPWSGVLLKLVIAQVAVLIIHRVTATVAMRLARHSDLLTILVRYGIRPSRWLLAVFALQLVLRAAPPTLPGLAGLQHFALVSQVITFTWLAIACVQAVADLIIRLNPADVADNLGARRVHTQTRVLARALMVLLTVIGTAAALMTFPDVRQFGASMLASAGVAGLVVGFAAKPVLGNLLAGLQIAMTQPIRLDDVVIVEGEWGRIEEISGTYVVVSIWDERRLIVPLQWFIEHPFQNWTRTGSQLLGTVFLWCDYRMPIEPLRAELRRLCEAAEEWDGRVCSVVVTDASDQAMQVRALVSAADSGRQWDLRCKVREGLIGFIQAQYPEHLPRLRADVLARADASSPQTGQPPASSRQS